MSANATPQAHRVYAATLRRAASLFRPYWRSSALMLAAIAVNAVLGLVGPLLTARLVDQAIPRRDLALLAALALLIVGAALVAGLIAIPFK